jgi:hypothetical protein
LPIGPALAEARTEAGMTVADVSERTRIRRAIISDIERDDYTSCGGDFYARGHIRAIAKVVGTNPVPLIEEYDDGVAARDAPLGDDAGLNQPAPAHTGSNGGSPSGGARSGGAPSGRSPSGASPGSASRGGSGLRTGPDPRTWLQAEGNADPLLWPPVGASGPDIPVAPVAPAGASRGPDIPVAPPSAASPAPPAPDPELTAMLPLPADPDIAIRPGLRTGRGHGAGQDTAPQAIVPYGPPATAVGGTGSSGGPGGSTVGAARLGPAALQRAGAFWRQVRAELPARLPARSGQLRPDPDAAEGGRIAVPGPDKLRDAAADLRRAGAGAVARISRLRTADQGPSRIIGAVAIILAVLILILYGIFSGPAHGSARPTAPPRHRVQASHPATRPAPSPARRASARPKAAARPQAAALRPAGVTAFGPGGTADGDNSQRAGQALTARAGGWHTNWYTTAGFGGLKGGTGLLVDMGRVVTISRTALRLGPAGGAVVELRAGSAATPAALRLVAIGRSHGGALVLAPSAPVRARYLLIWFTRLPPDSSGTYQATVNGISVAGSATPS